MTHNPSRRMFLRGRFSARKTAIRPPWALPGGAFLSACTRCDKCIEACPQRILAKDEDGYPKVVFTEGECTFCGECVNACTPQALMRSEGAKPWRVAALIGEACLARQGVVCRACGDNCPVQAIRFPPLLGMAARPVLDVPLCTGCGACYTACPARAISMESLDG